MTKELQGGWWGFSKAASALLCSALPQRIQDENLATGTDNLKYKAVFQICCVGRGGKSVGRWKLVRKTNKILKGHTLMRGRKEGSAAPECFLGKMG